MDVFWTADDRNSCLLYGKFPGIAEPDLWQYNISASFFERGIRCNCIEPANILTEINKVPREMGIGILEWQMRAGKAAPLHTITKPGEKKPMLGKPKDCANAIAYLADDVAARYISGAELKVDAGWLNM